MTIYRTYAEIQRELEEYQRVNEGLQNALEEAQKKRDAYKKCCEILTEKNMKMLGEMTVIATSRARVLGTLPPPAQWAERTATSYDRAVVQSDIDIKDRYPEFFNGEAAT